MKISNNWLQQFIKLDLSIEEISVLLTDLGLEVERIEKFESIKGGLKGVVVGKILNCIKHPNADRLKITEVDIGEKENLSIICGAPNVDKGQNVLVATIGTTLYTNDEKILKIKKGKIRGEVSEGMICAEDELGLGNDHSGIIVLENNYELGTPASSIFEVESDFIFEIGLTPNRADAMSHMGVARDLRAVCTFKNIPFKWNSPNISTFNVENKKNTIKVDVIDKKRCIHYYGLSISNVKVSTSPNWLTNKLNSIGITPKNNIVDITNYVLHELGQPLHAFDADKLIGDVVVKTCKENTKFKTLDGVERILHSEDLMICDDKEAHCIAGIFGGEKSGVNNKTNNVFLESAYFDPVSIRKTSKRHGLNTDASFRFERGIDPEIGITALKRAAILICELSGGNITSEIQKFSQSLVQNSKFFLAYDSIHKTIGQSINKKDINTILSSLDIKIDNQTNKGVDIVIPRYRVDVTRPADVIEEILRVYGYNNINNKPLLFQAKPPYKWNDNFKIEESISLKLAGLGFLETINNSLTSHQESFPFFDSVKILNPLGKDLSELRQSLIPNALEVLSFNINRQNKNLKLFEFGTIYGKNEDKFVEEKRLCIYHTGNSLKTFWDLNKPPNSFFYLKGIIKDVFKSLGFEINFNETQKSNFELCFELIFKNELYGIFGIISKNYSNEFNIDQEIYIAELNWSQITKKSFAEPLTFKNTSKFPSTKRDFSLLLDKNLLFDDIKRVALKTDNKILKSVELFDVYEGKNISENKKSYGISFLFQDENKTLTDKQVDKVMSKLRQKFIDEFNAELRQ